jgi:hypothetical protein
MSTITIKLNEKTQAGKALKKLLDFFKTQEGVEVVEEKSPYNKNFVEMVKKSAAEKGGKKVTAENLWESIR